MLERIGHGEEEDIHGYAFEMWEKTLAEAAWTSLGVHEQNTQSSCAFHPTCCSVPRTFLLAPYATTALGPTAKVSSVHS